jgi:hypothetical protein
MLFRLFLYRKNGLYAAVILLFLERERHQSSYVLWKAGNFHSFPNVAEDHQTKTPIVDKKGRFY